MPSKGVSSLDLGRQPSSRPFFMPAPSCQVRRQPARSQDGAQHRPYIRDEDILDWIKTRSAKLRRGSMCRGRTQCSGDDPFEKFGLHQPLNR
jgi:hypothetical protein